MIATGILLKYPEIGFKLEIDLGQIRYIHSNMSVILSITLVLMILTGLALYFLPLIIKKQNSSKETNTPEINTP